MSTTPKTLAPYIQAVGRGPSRGRPLTRDEAAEAMGLILSGEAAPEAVGALLMVMRFRGETAEEVAGFVEAVRARTSAWRGIGAAVDWPSYAAGRTRGLPLFLMAARLVALAGFPVVLHGWNSHQDGSADVRAALPDLDIRTARSPDEARAALAADGIVYLPLEDVCAEALGVLRLREVLGLRSCINTTLRLSNPSGAGVSVQGVFHPSYRLLQQDAARLLGERRMLVLKGGGGEFERHPSKAVELFGLNDGAPFEALAPPLFDEKRRLAEAGITREALGPFWRGETDDPFAEAVVLGTAAAALLATGSFGDLDTAAGVAAELWATRRDRAAA